MFHWCRKSAVQPILRDDNLRLVYAEPMRRALNERAEDLKSGTLLLVIFILATMLAWGTGSLHLGGESVGMILWHFVLLIASFVTALSPIIFGMLVVEGRRLRRDRAAFDALLTRYGR